MTALLTRAPAAASLRQLAVLETRRYARHPLFLLGVALTALTPVGGPEPSTSVYLFVIGPAAGLGVLGLVVAASLTRSAATLARGAGAAAVPERTQTAALALACLLPFAVGVLWWAWAVWQAVESPPAANGYPFGPVGWDWKVALLFGQSALAALGGPLLGIVVGRWLPTRGTAPLVAVLLVTACIVMQGLFEPLRRIRVVMPFTYWGGPVGIDGDDMRTMVFTGSPPWWVAYLACLCGLAVVAAVWHDPGARTPRLRAVAAALVLAAVATCLLAMVGGLPETLVNPLPSS